MAKLKELSGMREKFLANYIENGGDQVQAARDAGYSEKGLAQQASLVKIELRPWIEAALKTQLAGMVPMAMNTLKDLAKNGTTESVKLAAVNGILDRSGYKPVEQREELNQLKDRSALEAQLVAYVGQEMADKMLSQLKSDNPDANLEPPPEPEDDGATQELAN